LINNSINRLTIQFSLLRLIFDMYLIFSFSRLNVTYFVIIDIRLSDYIIGEVINLAMDTIRKYLFRKIFE